MFQLFGSLLLSFAGSNEIHLQEVTDPLIPVAVSQNPQRNRLG